MFDAKTKAAAAVVLTRYGATHFRMSAEGELFVETESGLTKVESSFGVSFLLSADQEKEIEGAYLTEAPSAGPIERLLRVFR